MAFHHRVYFIVVNFYPGTSFCIVLGARNLDASLFGVYNTLKRKFQELPID